MPLPVLFNATEPPSAALALPAWMSKALVLTSVPLAMVPPVCCTPATVSVKPPRLKLPPLTTSEPVSSRRSLAPSASVPALTVVVPV